jgi:hypothetical protein
MWRTAGANVAFMPQMPMYGMPFAFPPGGGPVIGSAMMQQQQVV